MARISHNTWNKSKWSRFIPHGNKVTRKLWTQMRQTHLNVQSLINICADIMEHQMKVLEMANKMCDVCCLILEKKSRMKWSNNKYLINQYGFKDLPTMHFAKFDPWFIYLHLDGVFSSKYSLQIEKYLQCLIPCLITKLGKTIRMQKIMNWSWKNTTCIKNHVKPCTTLANLNQCDLKTSSHVESITKWILQKLHSQGFKWPTKWFVGLVNCPSPSLRWLCMWSWDEKYAKYFNELWPNDPNFTIGSLLQHFWTL